MFASEQKPAKVADSPIAKNSKSSDRLEENVALEQPRPLSMNLLGQKGIMAGWSRKTTVKSGEPASKQQSEVGAGESDRKESSGWSSWLSDATDWVGDKASDATNWVGDKAGKAANWVDRQADSVAGWVGDKVDQGKEWVSERASSASQWVGNKVNQGKEWASEKVNQGKEWASEKASSVSKWVGDKVSQGKEWVGEKANGVAEWAENVGTNVSDWWQRNKVGSRELDPHQIALQPQQILTDLSNLERRYRNERPGLLGIGTAIEDGGTVLQGLRAHTRQGYQDGAFEDVLGEQALQGSELDGNAVLAGENTDFGHFIASLSGQFGGRTFGGRALSALHDLGSGISWGGDLGTVATNVAVGGVPVNQAMSNLASDEDLSADIAAVVVGNTLDEDENAFNNEAQGITDAVRDYDNTSFDTHVRTFVREELGGEFVSNQKGLHLNNSGAVIDDISWGIRDFLNARAINGGQAAQERDAVVQSNTDRVVAQAFLNYLARKGNFSY